jgi:transcriptional regulator
MLSDAIRVFSRGLRACSICSMYIPAAFREARLDVLHALIREHSFGTLVSSLEEGLFATHLPFLLDSATGDYGTLLGHMARANPHWRELGRAESLVIFQGPHAYISPSWYVTQPAVPTWNYSAVHAYGTALLIEDPRRVRHLLEQTVRTFDAYGWSTDTVAEEYIEKMSKAIVAFEIGITRIEGKRKLSQNRPVEDALGAVAGLRSTGDDLSQALAEDMRQVAHARR